MKPSVGEVMIALEKKPATEPALKVGGVITAITVVLAAVTQFVPDLLNDEQTSYMAIFAAIVLPIVTAAFTRDKVWSPATVLELLDKAVQAGKDASKTPMRYQMPPTPHVSEIDEPPSGILNS